MSTLKTNTLENVVGTTTITVDEIVIKDAYATDVIGGTIKIKVVGTDCYITTDGSTPGP